MDNPFTSYDWTGVTLLQARRTHTRIAGERHVHERPDKFYQLGLKHHGKTDVVYNGKFLKYHDFTVLYLPKEKCDRIDYTRTIVEPGVGAYIFFDSVFELPALPFTMSCENSPRVIELFYKICVLSSIDDCEKRLEAMSGFYKLLAVLSEAYIAGESGSLRRRLAPAAEYIAAHLTDEFIDLATLAELSGMSCDYFRHSFKRAYGISPIGYINRAKTELAKGLLLDGKAVGEVSRLMGFSCANYFARVFREQTGMSPSRFARGDGLM